MYCYEYCRTVKDRKQNMLPEEELYDKKGHRSVYGFSEKDCIIIKQRGTSKGYDNFTPFARVLLVDFDDQPEAADNLRSYLIAERLSFSMWTSGNRSVHFHIPHNPLYDKSLPFTHLMWLHTIPNMIDSQGRTLFDHNIYRATSLFRLPNTGHPSTGLKKELLELVEDKELHLDIIKDDRPKRKQSGVLVPSPCFETFLDSLQAIYLKGAVSGGKYNALFVLSVCHAEMGLSIRTAADILRIVNNSFEKPKSEEGFIKAIRDGYAYYEGRVSEEEKEENV